MAYPSQAAIHVASSSLLWDAFGCLSSSASNSVTQCSWYPVGRNLQHNTLTTAIATRNAKQTHLLISASTKGIQVASPALFAAVFILVANSLKALMGGTTCNHCTIIHQLSTHCLYKGTPLQAGSYRASARPSFSRCSLLPSSCNALASTSPLKCAASHC
jgi:hypothetical protein